MTDIEAIKKRHERLRNRGKGVKWWHQLSSFAKARIRCLHEDRETLLAALEAAQAEAAHYIRMTKQFRLTAEQRLAELEAKDKRIQELEKELPMHRLSTEAIGECRRIIKEIMGNHAAFIDDDVARTLLHMKDKIAKLEKQIQELNTNVSDCWSKIAVLEADKAKLEAVKDAAKTYTEKQDKRSLDALLVALAEVASDDGVDIDAAEYIMDPNR